MNKSMRHTTTTTVPETHFDYEDDWDPPPDLTPDHGASAWV